MKYLIILSVLFLAGCTEDNSDAYDALIELQKETQTNLTSCKNELAAHRSSNGGGFNQPEYQAPAEPQYEEVEYAQLEISQKPKCYSREMEACGMLFSDCNNGLVYRCMKDVVYKINTERKLVQDEE